MYHRQLVHVSKETPIERIFQKITGRKMTEAERLCFRLGPAKKNDKTQEAASAEDDVTAYLSLPNLSP